VNSWVVAHYAFEDSVADQVPYVVGAVDLDEGPRAFGRIEGVGIDESLAGLRVVMSMADRLADGLPVLTFVPYAAVPDA
jgi:uncharacterized OB-fold protein